MPLVLPVMGAANLPRGAHVRVKLGDIDEISLDIAGTVVERLDVQDDEGAQEDDGDADDDGEPVAGPIAIAVDMNEPEIATAEAVAVTP
jgi:exoribonuclease II